MAVFRKGDITGLSDVSRLQRFRVGALSDDPVRGWPAWTKACPPRPRKQRSALFRMTFGVQAGVSDACWSFELAPVLQCRP